MYNNLRDYPFKYSYGPNDDRVNDFYVPALRASLHYDRSAGYFSSVALALAATGLAGLISNGGTMRLLVGAQLDPSDVEAIRAGYGLREQVADVTLRHLREPTDEVMKDRFRALAWMIASGHLDIRVVLPVDREGVPLSAMEAVGYYHPKTGIFTDTVGDRLAFTGSNNESANAWLRNYEEFFVFRSWEEGGPYVAEAAARFERLWQEREPGWIALPVPEAARQHLLQYTPDRAPISDPLERQPTKVGEEEIQRQLLSPVREREQVIVQFLRDAPYLVGMRGLGAATCAVESWPHQQYVSQQVIRHYARRYLLADEVGLGKTIEAGLILRQLVLSGIVRRALILAPKAVLRQWQEELYEKFSLNVPRYDGTLFIDYHGEKQIPTSPNPWDEVTLALVSSQLVKRHDRQQLLLTSSPWDLVIVDEAHHARRKDFLNPGAYRPNRLLELLRALQLRTDGLLLMTATPMQVHPIEVWDLADLLGLSGEWGASGAKFLRFFQELRRPIDDADWDFIFRLVRDEVRVSGLDESFSSRALRTIGPVEWSQVEALLRDSHPSRAMRQLPPRAQTVAIELARQHTPLRRLIFRNTRVLLRRYVEQGLLQANVPRRDPRLDWIGFRPEERELYDRIEEYITHFYRRYEEERKGLGFIMTVYRRRLTSSFYAVRRSLERRLEFLRGRRTGEGAHGGLDEDDLHELELDDDPESLDEAPLYKEEMEYVEDFMHGLEALVGRDSKVEKLLSDLQLFFRQRDTVLIFTQYTDTMDFLREQLREVYGNQVACYSGRGGERWDGVLWVPATKEEIKNEFRQGELIKILLCTEAASEGLNLQTCGVLINYDMPWNPMRVEQRIGRVDRIGQRYEEVWIRNYFYEDTVEARVYRALSDRIAWFQHVVGPLQPILAQVGQIIQTLAMVPVAQRQQTLSQELERLQQSLDEARAGLDLDEWAEWGAVTNTDRSPVSLDKLQEFLTTLPTLQAYFRPHESITEAFWLQLDGSLHAVTFDTDCYDAHPNSLHLLTYGSAHLGSLLGKVSPRPAASDGTLLRLSSEQPLRRVAYYSIPNEGEDPIQVSSLDKVDRVSEQVAATREWAEEHLVAVKNEFQREVLEEWHSIETSRALQRLARQTALEARLLELLLQAAFVEVALGQQPDLWDAAPSLPSFDVSAIRNLGRNGYPFGPALKLVDVSGIQVRPTHPFYQSIQNNSAERLRRYFADIRGQLGILVRDLATVRQTTISEGQAPEILVQFSFLY